VNVLGHWRGTKERRERKPFENKRCVVYSVFFFFFEVVVVVLIISSSTLSHSCLFEWRWERPEEQAQVSASIAKCFSLHSFRPEREFEVRRGRPEVELAFLSSASPMNTVDSVYNPVNKRFVIESG